MDQEAGAVFGPKKWEQLVARLKRCPDNPDMWCDESGTILDNMMDEWGEHGWELVAAVYTASDDVLMCFFKQPKR